MSLKTFDIVGFSLTNELCYTNVLNMLDLAGMNVRSSDREEGDPLVIAGGGMANCCEPIAVFIDIFVLGEGEEAIVELAELVKAQKNAGATKQETLSQIAEKFDWAYVPAFHAGEIEHVIHQTRESLGLCGHDIQILFLLLLIVLAAVS